MAKRNKGLIPCTVYVGDRLWDDFTPEEKSAYADKMVRRMGETMERYFSQHPEVYAKFQDLREIDPDAEKYVVNREALTRGYKSARP